VDLTEDELAAVRGGEAWAYLRSMADGYINGEPHPDPSKLALAVALLDVDRRLRELEATPRRTRIEVIQNFEGADPDRVAKAFIDALERVPKGPA